VADYQPIGFRPHGKLSITLNNVYSHYYTFTSHYHLAQYL